MSVISTSELLPESIRQQLGRLRLRPRRLRTGGQKGERRSLARGTSLEFADFRPYVAGDDLRKLDWNVYARLERPVMKVYEDEQTLTVTLLLDTSLSMAAYLDAPSQSKLAGALRATAALGAIALQAGDALTVLALGQPHAPFVGRGRAQLPVLLRWLAQQTPQADTARLDDALVLAAPRLKAVGMCFVLSDCLQPEPPLRGLQALQASGHELFLLHTLAPEDLAPPLVGDLRLVDAETGIAKDLTITVDLRARYMAKLRAWQEGVRAACETHGAAYLPLHTDQPLLASLVMPLRRLRALSL